MKQRQIIFRLLFPTRQYAAKAVHPAMRPLYNPPASLESSLMLNRLCLFTSRTNMSGIAKRSHQISYLSRIITFIKAHTMFFLFSRLWPFHWNTVYSCLCHFTIMSVGSINRQANRHSRTFGKQTTFNTLFSSVRRVWAGFFPRQAGLWSWRRPSIAMTSQFLSIRHNLSMPSSRVSEKLRLLPIPEIWNGPYCWNKYPFHSRRSIDSRFAVRKEYRSLLCDPAPWVCRRQSDEYSDAWVSMARSFPIIRLKSCICFLFSVFSSLNPFKGIVASEYIGNSGVIRIGSKTI